MDRGGSHTLAALVAVVVLMVGGGCYKDKEGALLPCPSGGIELTPADAGGLPAVPPSSGPGECSGGACGTPNWSCIGTLCKHRPSSKSTTDNQIANFKLYGCVKPQICPDADLQAIRQEVGVGATDLLFLITNCSTGNQELQIDKVVVYGDDRCSFSNVTDADISPKTVPPGQTAAIRIVYNPAAAGEDHAELGVVSNAQNSSELRLRLCALTVGTGFWPTNGWPSLQCKTQTSLAACHK